MYLPGALCVPLTIFWIINELQMESSNFPHSTSSYNSYCMINSTGHLIRHATPKKSLRKDLLGRSARLGTAGAISSWSQVISSLVTHSVLNHIIQYPNWCQLKLHFSLIWRDSLTVIGDFKTLQEVESYACFNSLLILFVTHAGWNNLNHRHS